MAVLEWLGWLLKQLFPPWIIVPRTHTAVRQRNLPLPARWKTCLNGRRMFGLLIIPEDGSWIRDCGSGWVFQMPFIDETWELPVTYESEDLENVEAETADGVVYMISPVLTWKVFNPIKAAFAVQNYEDSLKNAIRAVVVEWVNLQHGRIDVRRMSEECTAVIKSMGKDWGCSAKLITFNSCAPPWSAHELRHILPLPR